MQQQPQHLDPCMVRLEGSRAVISYRFGLYSTRLWWLVISCVSAPVLRVSPAFACGSSPKRQHPRRCVVWMAHVPPPKDNVCWSCCEQRTKKKKNFHRLHFHGSYLACNLSLLPAARCLHAIPLVLQPSSVMPFIIRYYWHLPSVDSVHSSSPVNRCVDPFT